MPAKKPHPGRRGHAVSLSPLTLDQALGGLLKVKPADVAKLEAKEKNKGKPKRKRSRTSMHSKHWRSTGRNRLPRRVRLTDCPTGRLPPFSKSSGWMGGSTWIANVTASHFDLN